MSQILDRVLAAARQLGASDVHLKAGLPPIFRIKGDLRTVRDVPALTRESIAQFAVHMMNDRQREEFEQNLDIDLAYGTPDGVRYRVNLFQQRGSVGMVLRLIPPEVPPFERLNIPQTVLDLANTPRGIVLVTGATGSGKSTTLAAMIDYINTQNAQHIVTVEDPIEYTFRDKRSVINQREIGFDTMSFARALRAALRQDPDVILVGEMRDFETAGIAMTAAETGHLVLSTLHTVDATETINRIISMFPTHQQQQARLTLASVLRGVISQRLLPRADGKGMVPALEIMVNTERIREMIEDPQRTREIKGAIIEGLHPYGMVSFDQSLSNLVKQKLVTYEEAIKHSTSPADFALLFRGVSQSAGAWKDGAGGAAAGSGSKTGAISNDEFESNRWLIIVVVLAGWLVLPTSANAGGRKRVVVLELDGPKAEKFHDDLVKLIKKNHTVIPIDKWNGTAEELDASSPNDKNIKKVAKKLKIDAVVTGKIEKRRDNYIIQLKVHEGKSGGIVGSRIDVKAEGPRIDGEASSSLKDELLPTIDSVPSNRGGSGDGEEDGEDEEKPAKKKAGKKDEAESEDEEKPAKKGFGKKKDDKKDEAESEDEEKPAKKGFGKKKDDKKDEAESEDEEKPAKKGFGKHSDEDTNALRTKKDDEEKAKKAKKDDKDEEEESPLPKAKKAAKKDEDEEDGEEKKPKKKVAKKEDGEEEEEEGVEASSEGMEGAEALTPGERAVDAVLGLSLNARRMAFTYASDLGNNPKPYKGVPVAGVLIDATVFPLAVGHKRHDMLKNIGIAVMYDKVIKINSKQGDVTLPTSQARYAFGAAFRYPLGAKAVVGGVLRYGRQNFTIGSAGGVTSEMPNVNYTILDPGVFFRYSATPKIILNVNLGFMAFLDTGAIQKNDSYGAATVTGFEGEIGGDYLLTKNIFARAAFKFETIGFTFKGSGAMTTGRDTDPEQDVFGASDKYLGGAVTVGYLY